MATPSISTSSTVSMRWATPNSGIRSTTTISKSLMPPSRILTLSISDGQTIDPKRRRRKLYSRKPSLFCDALQLSKRVSIPLRRRGQHHHAERCRNRRRYAVGIGNQFKNGCPTARFERGMHLFHEGHADRGIEMMQEIGDQRQIVAAAEVHLESISRKKVIAVPDSHCLRILLGNRQHVLPV